MATTSEPADAAQGFHSLFLEHLSTYSLVEYAYKTAHTCYTRVKTANRYLEYGLETAEYVTTTATKTAEPLLSKVDAFGYKQLVRAEETLSGSYETVTHLPYNLLEKTLDVGEDSLNYWLPVDDSSAEPKEHQEKQAEKEAERNLTHLSSRAFTILDSFQDRTKEKLYSYPAVATVVDSTKTKLDEARALKSKVVSLPSTLHRYYTQQKQAILARLASYYSSLTRPIFSLTDRAFELLHAAKEEYQTIRSSSFQELGIRFANNVHSLSTLLYEKFYPTTAIKYLNQRVHQLLERLTALNPLRKRTEHEANGSKPERNGN